MKYHLTMKDVRKYEILKQAIVKELKGTKAAGLLGIPPVHISRLKKKVIASGIKGILRPKLPSNHKLPDSLKEQIKRLYREIYYDFNIRHFNDNLQEKHKINLSYETVRQILISNRIHIPKKKKLVHRRRMPHSGLLIQTDSSEHNWLPFIKEKWFLTTTIR